MSFNISGRAVLFSIAAGYITAAHAATASGIVENFSVALAGGTTEIADEDDDIVSRIDHQKKNTVSFEIIAEADSVLPKKGDEITGMGTIDGVSFSTGRVFVDTATATSTKAQAKKITVSCTHYPDMGADD